MVKRKKNNLLISFTPATSSSRWKSTFTTRLASCNADLAMQCTKRLLPIALLVLLGSACTTTITNLTPSQQMRNATGLYPVEVAWQTREQALRRETLKPSVMIGTDSYAMQPTPLVTNRWETLVPIPADKNAIHYRFKFDYEVATIPARQKNSRMSQEFKLEVVDKK